MTRIFLCLTLGVLLVAGTLSPVQAQEKDTDPVEAFRRLRRLETPLDFWNAIQFELDLGKTDIAARYLRGLINKKPTDKDLYAILDRDGITSVMRLRNIREWTTDKNNNAQAIKDAETLVDLVTQANKKRLADDARIRELITQLNGTPEEKSYALAELYKIGATVVPHVLDFLARSKEANDRHTYKQALLKMGPATLAPLLAALDSNNVLLKLDILDVLRQRHFARSAEILPWLQFPSASPSESPLVRAKARKILAEFQELPEDKLPPAKHVLTEEAERYFEHKVNFGDPRNVTIWRWDGNKLVRGWPKAETVTASQAEQYYGLRFARQALQLDPDYAPAQLIALSLAVEKAAETAGGAPLSRVSPEVAALLARANPDLVLDMLDKALKEKRTGIVLAAVRSLGDRAEVRAKRPGRGGEPALVRALYYPDPRVQLAAAHALLRIPGPVPPRASTRIVEVLTRALSSATAYLPGPKVLVALTDQDIRDRVRQTAYDVGANPILVSNGRDAIRQLRANAQIEAILLDSTLPFPGLANTLAQMRQDVDVQRIPILLAAIPETRIAHDAAIRFHQLRTRRDVILKETQSYRQRREQINREENQAKREIEKDFANDRRPSAQDEKMAAYRQIEDRYAARRALLDKQMPAAVAVLKEVPQLEAEMAKEVERYDLEAQLREAALERYIASCRYEGVKVVHKSLLVDRQGLDQEVLGSVRAAATAYSEEEKQQAADLAMELLANLAEGKPAGFDVQPASEAIQAALRSGRLSPAGQKAGIRAVTRLDGPEAQATLAVFARDAARSIELREAALRGLIANIQRQGRLLPPAEIKALDELSREAGLDARLRDQLHNLAGVLRATPRGTGERLRNYRPTPTPALPPPPPTKPVDKDRDAL